MRTLLVTFFMTAFVFSQESVYKNLFPTDGKPADWVVTEWNKLEKQAAEGTAWEVKQGILCPSSNRGTWFISKKEYVNFILEFEVKLEALGNSGVALRAPMKGDPAFDGLEFQIADFRYNTKAKDSELTGGLYRAVAPSKQVYKPEAWNKVSIELNGRKLKAVLNGEVIQDIDLDSFDKTVKRHDGTDASPIKDRPSKGHIGFQHLSRDSSPVLYRNVRIKELP